MINFIKWLRIQLSKRINQLDLQVEQVIQANIKVTKIVAQIVDMLAQVVMIQVIIIEATHIIHLVLSF